MWVPKERPSRREAILHIVCSLTTKRPGPAWEMAKSNAAGQMETPIKRVQCCINWLVCVCACMHPSAQRFPLLDGISIVQLHPCLPSTVNSGVALNPALVQTQTFCPKSGGASHTGCLARLELQAKTRVLLTLRPVTHPLYREDADWSADNPQMPFHSSLHHPPRWADKLSHNFLERIRAAQLTAAQRPMGYAPSSPSNSQSECSTCGCHQMDTQV